MYLNMKTCLSSHLFFWRVDFIVTLVSVLSLLHLAAFHSFNGCEIQLAEETEYGSLYRAKRKTRNLQLYIR